MGSPTINGGHLHYHRHKKKEKTAPTLAQREHAVQLKEVQIQNYKLCYTNIEKQTKERQATYRRYLEHLEKELADLQEAVARHPEASVM